MLEFYLHRNVSAGLLNPASENLVSAGEEATVGFIHAV